jgi:ADP-heptose:LPS heptosyltransferase
MPQGPGPHHAIPVLLEFARTLGIESDVSMPLELRPGPDFPWKAFFKGDAQQTFVIFTDSRGVEKEWPKFSALTRMIFEHFPDSRIAWCAGKAIEPDFAVPEGRFLNLSGCPFDEMIELTRQASVFIGNDSGPMHLSAAVGNRVLAIFGPTSPERFGPWPPQSPHNASIVAPAGVLADLRPETVLRTLDRLCSKQPSETSSI